MTNEPTDNNDSHEPLNPSTVAEIKKRLLQKEFQHKIAADYGINQGRISEINTGKTWKNVKPKN